jgi:hypothetical protein
MVVIVAVTVAVGVFSLIGKYESYNLTWVSSSIFNYSLLRS